MSDHSELTQKFSTFGDKLLQHTDVLYSIQYDKKFKPITVQLAPTNKCDLKCEYCSVKNRDVTSEIPFNDIINGLQNFKNLGAKALEISGGGNPLLYPYINEVVNYAYSIGFEIGVITNSTHPSKYLSIDSINKLSWIRISLSSLDNNNRIFDLDNIPSTKLGLSYIINHKTAPKTITNISDIAKKYDVKFVRLAPDCLNDDALTINTEWDELIKSQNNGKLFIKEIGENYHAYCNCYVGLIRPYWTPEGIFICSSHVLETQKVENGFKLYDIDQVVSFYEEANTKFSSGELPYKINTDKCYHCYYFNNNKILHTVATELPDRNFA